VKKLGQIHRAGNNQYHPNKAQDPRSLIRAEYDQAKNEDRGRLQAIHKRYVFYIAKTVHRYSRYHLEQGKQAEEPQHVSVLAERVEGLPFEQQQKCGDYGDGWIEERRLNEKAVAITKKSDP